MSFYNSPYFTIYDLIDSLNQRRQVQGHQQRQFHDQAPYGHPVHPRYYQQQRPYYSTTPSYEQSAEPESIEEEQSEDEEQDDQIDDRDTLYRSLYGDAPFVYQQPKQWPRPQRPVPMRRLSSYPRPPHPAESAIDLLNLLGANLSYPDQEQLPTRKTLNKDENLTDEQPEIPETEKLQKTPEVEAKPKSSFKRPPVPAKKSSLLNLHASAPSPKLDPLQVSKPQLSTNLPFSPPINVYDRPEEYVVIVAIPGSEKGSFHVDFHPTSHDLVVKGEVKNKYHDSDPLNDSFIKVSEQRFGSFERNIKFPTLPKINDEQIKAVYSNGLLEITIPKITKFEEPPKSKRRIEIEEVEDEELQREERGYADVIPSA